MAFQDAALRYPMTTGKGGFTEASGLSNRAENNAGGPSAPTQGKTYRFRV